MITYQGKDDVYAQRDDDKQVMVTVSGGTLYPGEGESSLALFRQASDTGLPSGNRNIVGDYSSVNKDFYIEALEGERLAVRRAIVHLYVVSQDIESGTYGNIAELANGLLLIYQKDGIILDVTNDLPIKKQEDWGRECFDAAPVGPYGPAQRTPFFQVRLSFNKFAGENGIILEEGDRLGVRVRDNLPLATLQEHYITFQGEHIGTPNAAWQNIIPAL